MSPPANPWAQSLDGRAIDLLAPAIEDVDFDEIAAQLARLNRYAGATRAPVSVALHTIIACAAAPEAARPWVLIHDAHEARIGDIPTPARRALVALVADQGGLLLGTIVAEAFDDLALAHDQVIHAAAGLAMPDAALRKAIRRADLVALVTERRDFMAEPPCSWGAEIEALAPVDAPSGDGSWTAWAELPVDTIAEALAARFRAYLPAEIRSAERNRS